MDHHFSHFSFVELPVRDFDTARHFYEHVLKLRLAHLDRKNKWCLYRIPGSDTGCAIYDSPVLRANTDAPESGSRIVVQVDCLDDVLSQLTQQGVTVEPVRHHQEEGFYISGFRDPDGNVWRVWAK